MASDAIKAARQELALLTAEGAPRREMMACPCGVTSVHNLRDFRARKAGHRPGCQGWGTLIWEPSA